VGETEHGITTRSFLLAFLVGGIHEVTRKVLDATRALEFTKEMGEKNVTPHIAEIPIGTEDMVSYSHVVHDIQRIKTAAS
ncbi:hypothetical protein Angca_000514, partial [Angiostrongylus cantonensis]